jgi:hypothetical protein
MQSYRGANKAKNKDLESFIKERFIKSRLCSSINNIKAWYSNGSLHYLKELINNWSSGISIPDIDHLPIHQMVYNCLNSIKKHPRCPVCNKKVTFYSFTQGYNNHCSTKCAQNNKVTKKKIKETNIKKYGVESLLSNNIWKEKVIFDKHGVLNGNQVKGSVDKARKTRLKKYGDPTYNNVDKARKTRLKKYGDPTYNNVDKAKVTVKRTTGKDMCFKARKSFKEYYDVGNPSELKYVQNKKKKNSLKKYGVLLQQKHLLPENIKLANNKEHLIYLHHKLKIPLYSIAETFGYHQSHMSKIFSRLNIKVKYYNSSYKENLLYKEIRKRYKGPIVRNVRLLGNKEIDIYLPNLKIGFEFNGLYFHRNNEKSSISKTKKAFKKGITLYHINEHLWDNKKNIIFRKLDYIFKLGKVIYARKCIIKEIKRKERKFFLDTYHLKGDGFGSVCYGLFLETKLVGVIVFKVKADNVLYLNRFASLNVVGGFSKLLKFVEKKYKPNSIETFVDICWSGIKPTVYEHNGFKKLYLTKPNYIYFKGKTILSRHQCMKHKLSGILDKFDSNLTEEDNMLENNFYRFYDAGSIKLIK